MAAMFGYGWVSQYGAIPDGEAADTWATALTGVTATQIANGLRETLALGQDWPPSAPKFRSLCFGIPPFERVRVLVTQRDKSPFIRLVWQNLDAWAFGRSSQADANRMLKTAYETARDHVMRGGALPDDPVAEIPCELKTRTPASGETVEKHCAEIAAILGGGST